MSPQKPIVVTPNETRRISNRKPEPFSEVSQRSSDTSYETKSNNRFYVSLNGGAAFTQNLKSDLTSSSDFILDTGVAGYHAAAAAGYKFLKNFRVELEGSFSRTNINKATVALTSLGLAAVDDSVEGHVNSLAAMGNIYYDFSVVKKYVPYIMGGVGGVYLELDNVDSPSLFKFDDKDFAIAFQFGAGIHYLLTDNMSLDFSYRFFKAIDPKFQNIIGTEIKPSFNDHRLGIGILYSF